jgi:hypothetical protein
VANILRAMVWPLMVVVGVAAAAEPPGSMSAYGLKPATPQTDQQQSSPEPQYVFPELEEPERNPWSGVQQEPYGSPNAPVDHSLNPWVGGNMPPPPDTAVPPSRYAPDDHREGLMERPVPGYDRQGAHGQPGYDRQDAYGQPGYDRAYEYGYPRTYPGYGYRAYDPLLSPYGTWGYPGYGYGYDGYPGTGGWGLPFMGSSPFDWFF